MARGARLYFWKSANWVRGIELLAEDEPGFWEGYGCRNYGDPWTATRRRLKPRQGGR